MSSDFSMTADGMTIVYIHENPRMPAEVVYLSSRVMIPVLITRLNPQIEPVALGQVETIRWKSSDGALIEGLLYYPIGYQTGNRYPLITYIHGGPEGAYTRGLNSSWMAFPQIYAGRGYAVFMPNFRGSSNYGARFAQANARLAGKIDYDDIVTGIDDLIKKGLADSERLAIAGWSYGGYLSALMIGKTNRFKCAVYGAGLSNAVSYWGTADIVSQRERLHGGVPWEARKSYEDQSPLTWLRNAKTPALIFHGEKDERVPLGQSQETYRTLKRLGVNTQLIIYPNEGHVLTVPSYQLDKMRREFNWIDKFIGARQPGV
ncbi:MAG: S9 family peptidase [Acidobacteria bacterium]|nr:S9 family peptidase [Acidobacteriota bacterium]